MTIGWCGGRSRRSRLWCRRCGRVDAERPIEDQIAVLMGHVYLWNDVKPIIDSAQWVVESTGESGPHIEALIAALNKYEELYPEHKVS
jgi:hypothetical protein